ncbi:MAG: hypothetical protein NTW18_06650 [Candidatus Omnitrophica bacterium]|nr:hypothetical protein [Candidatus Omnitrophota bacterium]
MFEQKHQKIAPVSVFIRRVAVYIGIAILVILIALFIGVAGYHWIAGFSWVDSLLNASMILGGMGPVNLLSNASAKVFASLYALFSGLVFIAVMGIVFTPIVHRMLHKFHMDEKDLKGSI